MDTAYTIAIIAFSVVTYALFAMVIMLNEKHEKETNDESRPEQDK